MESTAVRCFTCGAKTVKYKHGLNKGLVRALYKFFERNGPHVGEVSAVALTHNEAANFQKLRYWGLVDKPTKEGEKGGLWYVTAMGIGFIFGHHSMPKYATTYRGIPHALSGPNMMFSQITDGYVYRGQWSNFADGVGSSPASR